MLERVPTACHLQVLHGLASVKFKDLLFPPQFPAGVRAFVKKVLDDYQVQFASGAASGTLSQ